MKKYKIRIHGRVQGVGFRYAASREARRLGLKGWIRNEDSGTVLSLIQGKEEACRAYIAWCRRGSGYSWVEKIELTELSPGEEPLQKLPPFRILH